MLLMIAKISKSVYYYYINKKDIDEKNIDIIENYASGVRRIFEDYADFKKKPEYYISNNGIIVTLFNRNYEGQSEGQNIRLGVLERRNKILKLIKENNHITASILKDILGVSKSTIERDISKLREDNKLIYIGSSKKVIG
ncbi:HTH domain-containing protein [Streptobacillus moniliformis]|nr:HTH domain-containing protein [Streptobacillus moniliformis]